MPTVGTATHPATDEINNDFALANLTSSSSSALPSASVEMGDSAAAVAAASGHRRRRSASLTGSPAVGTAGSRSARKAGGQIQEVEEYEGLEDSGSEGGDKGAGGRGADEWEWDEDEEDDDEDEEGPSDEDEDEETGLTSAERRKRRRRRRRKRDLGDRVAGGEEHKLSVAGQKAAKSTFVRDATINVALIASWYTFSVSISVYNKWMFSDRTSPDENTLNLPFPLFITSFHMVIQFMLAGAVLYFIPRLRPQRPERSSTDIISSNSKAPPIMSKMFYLTRLGPCGTATGIDIGFGNMSLRFISLTFYTMCKSSVLGFVLVFAFIFKLERPSWKLGGIIATMTVGVVMMVAGEAAFHALGFVLIMLSCLSSGFRWSLTQILLLRHPATSNPFSSIFFLSPIMCISMLLFAFPVEGLSPFLTGLHTLSTQKGPLISFLLLLFPGCLAFLMTSAEFALLKRTSVVTLSICGIFKEVITISTSSILFHDELTPVNLSGLFVTIASIATYNYMKIVKMKDDALLKAAGQETGPGGEAYDAVATEDVDADAVDVYEVGDDDAVADADADTRPGASAAAAAAAAAPQTSTSH